MELSEVEQAWIESLLRRGFKVGVRDHALADKREFIIYGQQDTLDTRYTDAAQHHSVVTERMNRKD